MAKRKMPTCSFCGRARNQVNQLLVGPGGNICDACVELSRKILSEGSSAPGADAAVAADAADNRVVANSKAAHINKWAGR